LYVRPCITMSCTKTSLMFKVLKRENCELVFFTLSDPMDYFIISALILMVFCILPAGECSVKN
jgi:hypothetical protein